MPKKHKCSFQMHYVAGEAYEVCPCGAVQRVGPGGKRSKAPKSLVALARRNHGIGAKQ
jgi:hypothetical protein